MADLEDILNTLIAEAYGEGDEGMRRVGETILNRSAIRGIDPAAVVRQPSQYTGFFAPGPAAVAAQNDPLVRSAAEAAWALAKQPGDPTDGADHYFNPKVVNPGWQGSMQHTGDYLDHTFYRSRAVPQDALAALLTPLTRDVAFPRARPEMRQVDLPRARPASPSEAIASLFGGSFGTQQDPATARGLTAYLAKQQAPSTGNLTMPGAIDRTVNSLPRDNSLAAALSRVFAPKSAPQMPTNTRQTFAAQDGLLADRARQIAEVFGSGGDTGANVNGPVLAQISTSNIGKPPTTRVVPSVPVSTAKVAAPKQTTAQIRADNGQTRPAAAATAKKAPLSIGATPAFAAQDRAVASRINDVGAAPAYGDLALMFGSTPQASNSVNNKKGDERLAPNSTWTVSEAERMSMHGLTPPATANVQETAEQVALPRKRPATPQKQQVAITQPRKVAPAPMAASMRPQQGLTAPMIQPRAQASSPPRVTVQGGNYSRPAPVFAGTKMDQLLAHGFTRAGAYEALNAAARGAPSLEDRITGRANGSDGTAQSISG